MSYNDSLCIVRTHGIKLKSEKHGRIKMYKTPLIVVSWVRPLMGSCLNSPETYGEFTTSHSWSDPTHHAMSLYIF